MGRRFNGGRFPGGALSLTWCSRRADVTIGGFTVCWRSWCGTCWLLIFICSQCFRNLVSAKYWQQLLLSMTYRSTQTCWSNQKSSMVQYRLMLAWFSIWIMVTRNGCGILPITKLTLAQFHFRCCSEFQRLYNGAIIWYWIAVYFGEWL